MTSKPEVSLSPAAEVLLGIVAVLLFAGSGEMFAHNRILQAWQRFKEAWVGISLVEEPKQGASVMGVHQCVNCGTKIDVAGLVPSIGGYRLYCSVCGHHWHVE